MGANGGTFCGMASIARLLQLAGLTVPPLAIFAELNHAISLGQMLKFLVASICMFSIGYLMRHYTSSQA